jgi:hypothetical protein
MLREVHEHVVGELQQNARTDTVFVVTAVLFNLVVMGINWGVASESGDGVHPPENDWILGLLIIATLLINSFALRALLGGRDTRRKLLSGLVAMYEDNGVDKYYDPSVLDVYATRYKLFISILGSLAAISIIVPLIERLLG